MSTPEPKWFDQPFVAAAADGFVYAGKRYAAGEAFPARELGIDEAELWDLWAMSSIGAAPPAAAAAAAAPTKPVAKPSTVTKPQQQNQLPARR